MVKAAALEGASATLLRPAGCSFQARRKPRVGEHDPRAEVALRRGHGLPLRVFAMVLMLVGGCAPASARRETAADGPRPGSPTVVEPGSPEPQTAEPPVDVGAESLRTWLLEARPRAVVEVEPAPGPGDSAWHHVRVRDGDVSFEAWLGAPGDDAARWWRVADIAAAALRMDLVALETAAHWRLWAAEGAAALVCPGEGACAALPQLGLVTSFYGFDERRCRLVMEGDAGRVERWDLEVRRPSVRRRLRESWPSVSAELTGPFAAVRGERRGWETLTGREPRPAALDDPALATVEDPADDDSEFDSACRPTVRSLRDGDRHVRIVGCGAAEPFALADWPTAVVVTGEGRPIVRLIEPGLAPAEPLRVVDVGGLAPGALGLTVEQSEASSPSGSSREELWVLAPPSWRVHSLELGGVDTEGLGTEDERDGYVVAVDRRRATFEVAARGLGRLVACERWVGTHARRARRWDGERLQAPLDLPVPFDAERGFVAPERGVFDACRPTGTTDPDG